MSVFGSTVALPVLPVDASIEDSRTAPDEEIAALRDQLGVKSTWYAASTEFGRTGIRSYRETNTTMTRGKFAAVADMDLLFLEEVGLLRVMGVAASFIAGVVRREFRLIINVN